MGAPREAAMNEVTERIIELEIRYAHQASLVEELNVELTAANARIDKLEREALALRDSIRSMEPDLSESPDE